MFEISNEILRPTEYEIMKFLALNGPSNRYEISKGTGLHYQTVYAAIKRLLQKRLFIDIFDVEKARTGFDKPLYFVTFIGKLAAMAMSENDDDVLDLIATSEPRQFLILEEWEYICQYSLAREYVLSIIRTALLDILRTWSFEMLDEAQIPKKQANEVSVIAIGYSLLEKILWDGYPRDNLKILTDYGRTYNSELLQFFMDNPQIREQIKRSLRVMEEKARYEINVIGEVRRKYGIEMT